MKRIPFLLSLLLALCFSAMVLAPAQLSVQAQQTAAAPALKKTEQMVPMRDGVKLATSIFLPEGNGPFPIVLQRTPYGKEAFSQGAAGWTKAGFAFVVQDCRGKGKSEGAYHPFVEDPQDGFDSVEWLAKQPWSTGKIGMYGASAMGIAANLAAMENPPHLKAIFVMVARSSIYHQSAFMGGVFRRELN
jgi:uncharacterized protein